MDEEGIEFELSNEQLAELKRRQKDLDDPVRYVVYNSLMGKRRRWVMWHNAADDLYCFDIEEATLYKRYRHARTMADVIVLTNIYIAKITTKNKRLRVLKYDYHE